MSKREAGKILDIHKSLKQNERITKAVLFISCILCCASFFFCYYIYRDSQKRLFAIDETGHFIPLSRLDDKQGRLIEVKSNVKYFVDNYYTLSAYTIKEKKEKLLWLVGEQPKVIIQNRINKGYFDDFISINGLTQIGTISEQSFKIMDSEEPFVVSCEVIIQRINGTESRFYRSKLAFQLETVDRNYPYNPFGLLITNFKEELEEVELKNEKSKVELIDQEEKINNEELNQLN
ncbi:MAG: hypothetical protein RL662_2185 [Bacteroidota bacterium]|jgi:hypothetical protein